MGIRRLRASLRLWERRAAFRARRLAYHERRHNHTKAVKWRQLDREAQQMVAKRTEQLARAEKAAVPLRVRAYKVAEGLVGAEESWGPNAGPTVDKIIDANGGSPGESWCGDFDAYCYRAAGSKSVGRFWASVPMLSALMRVGNPQEGNVIRYSFGTGSAQHTGLFGKWLGGGWFEAIEGNTSNAGAIRGPADGREGVYLKKRHISQVLDFRRVLR